MKNIPYERSVFWEAKQGDKASWNKFIKRINPIQVINKCELLKLCKSFIRKCSGMRKVNKVKWNIKQTETPY